MHTEDTRSKPNIFSKIINFYVDGFRNMTIGKTLWLVILIKLFIIFAVLKLFFFPDFLSLKNKTDDEKAKYVRTEMIQRN